MFLVRRFRRLVNPLLALATAVALGVVVVPLVGQETRAQVTESARALDLLVDRWRAHTTETGATARRELLVLLDRHCGGERDGCGDTVARVRRDLGPAADERGLIPLVPIGGSAVVLLVLLGLLGRLEEYRYRVR